MNSKACLDALKKNKKNFLRLPALEFLGYPAKSVVRIWLPNYVRKFYKVCPSLNALNKINFCLIQTYFVGDVQRAAEY
jgi:hypothetical protein